MDLGKYRHIGLSVVTGSLLLVGLFLLLNGTPQTARADFNDLFVTLGGSGDCSQATPCNLQTALGLAGDGDTLYVAAGIYTGTGDAVVTVTKSIILYGGWDGSLTTPPLRDPATYRTILDGEDARRVVYIAGAISPTLDGFTITRGNASTVASDPRTGGGIYSSSASPIIRNNVIVSNTGSAGSISGCGGGIYLHRASASTLISGNQVLSNTTYSNWWSWGGGGLYLSDSDATILGNLIQGNHCPYVGGGLYLGSSGAPRILGNEIRANTAGINGGGIYARFAGQMYAEDNWIVENVAGSYGGGICVVNNHQPTIVANRVLSNTASGGAGLLIETDSYYTVTNNFVAYNGDGAGIKIWDTTKHGLLAHNTVAFNTGTGGGISLDAGYITPTVVSNIVVSNTYGIRAHTNASGTLDYNDVWGNTVQDYDLPGALDPGPHDIQADPLFIDPAGNDFHLQAESPCIDAGGDVGVPSDIDGDPRPVNGLYDIGADEFRLRYLYLPLVARSYS